MRAHCFEKHCLSRRHKGVCKRMFLENTKGTKHTPSFAFSFPSVPPHTLGQGSYFSQLTLGMSRCSVSVSRSVLSPLPSVCGFGMLSSGSSPFAASPPRPPGPRSTFPGHTSSPCSLCSFPSLPGVLPCLCPFSSAWSC